MSHRVHIYPNCRTIGHLQTQYGHQNRPSHYYCLIQLAEDMSKLYVYSLGLEFSKMASKGWMEAVDSIPPIDSNSFWLEDAILGVQLV